MLYRKHHYDNYSVLKYLLLTECDIVLVCHLEAVQIPPV